MLRDCYLLILLNYATPSKMDLEIFQNVKTVLLLNINNVTRIE
jgi:hypothetical protein